MGLERLLIEYNQTIPRQMHSIECIDTLISLYFELKKGMANMIFILKVKELPTLLTLHSEILVEMDRALLLEH